MVPQLIVFCAFAFRRRRVHTSERYINLTDWFKLKSYKLTVFTVKACFCSFKDTAELKSKYFFVTKYYNYFVV